MRRVLITGANRGIGLGLVRQCLKRGYRVFAGCRSPEDAADLHDLSGQSSGLLNIVPLDVSDEEVIAECVQLVGAEVDRLDLLINNAAIHPNEGSLSAVKREELLQSFLVNAVGPVLVAQYFMHLLKNGYSPKIINISSEAGSISKMTQFRGYGYYGSKAAVNMFTRSLAFDSETEGVIVIALHPGWVRTEMGGPNAYLSTDESAVYILKVIDGLKDEDNGKFYNWEGIEHPW